MEPSRIRDAVGAARSTASALGLSVDDAVVLHRSNRIAVRLLPCEVLARVAEVKDRAGADTEVEIAGRLGATNAPIATLEQRVEPRVYLRDGFAVTLWTYYEPVVAPDVAPAEYGQALRRLHAGMREIDPRVPHFTDRVATARGLVRNPDQTPDLGAADRDLLSQTLGNLTRVIGQRGAPEQLLHGEPHPGNLLRTEHGVLFADLETCCRGPVEFDLAYAPEEVSGHYPGVDQDLLSECRILMLAMISAWRWDRDDRLPDGHRLGREWLGQLRTELDAHGFDAAP